MKKTDERGVIYIALQSQKYYVLSLLSAVQFIFLNPGIPITILTDSVFSNDDRIEKMGISIQQVVDTGLYHQPFDSRKIKTDLFKYSRYETTLFLDSDILPLLPCTELWEIATKYDFSIVRDMWENIGESEYSQSTEGKDTLHNYSPQLHLYNSGVILFNGIDAVADTFNQWNTQWQKYGVYDQFALVRAISNTNTQVHELENRFNTLVNGNITVDHDKIVFLHLLKFWVTWEKTIEFYKTMAPDAYYVVLDILEMNQEDILKVGESVQRTSKWQHRCKS
jgi:hypothetical protein